MTRPQYTPRLIATTAEPAPTAIHRRKVTLTLASSQDTIPELLNLPRGVGYGRREFRPNGHRQPHAYRDACKAVCVAADALNALLPCEGWENGRAPGDHAPLDSAETAEALRNYRMACAGLIDAASRPSHTMHVLRATAELIGLCDPVWTFSRDYEPTREEQTFARVTRKLDLIMEGAGL